MMHANGPGTVACPYCGAECECDKVNVGIGFVQCGPYHCEGCDAGEIGPNDDLDKLTELERTTGWFEPRGGRVSVDANTFLGQLVDHKTALSLYRMGLLDEKRPGPDASKEG